MTIKQIQEQTGLSVAEIARLGDMPLRTVENWKRTELDGYQTEHLYVFLIHQIANKPQESPPNKPTAVSVEEAAKAGKF